MLKNLSIRNKLLVLLFLPTIGLVFFSLRETISKYQIMNSVQQTKNLVAVSLRCGAVAHELQKERGMSAGFLASKGVKFRSELAKQRELSDQQFQQLDSLLSTDTQSSNTLKETIGAASSLRSNLKMTRTTIDQMTIEGKDSFGYYSKLIYAYLDVVAAVARTAQETDLMCTAVSYFAFSKMKEEVGRERATVNGVLSANGFTDETYQRLFSLLSAQQSYRESFFKFAPSTMVTAYRTKESAPQFTKVEELRNSIISKGMAGAFGIAPEEWFGAITAKINLMKETEDEIAKGLYTSAETKESDARVALLFSLIVSTIMGVLTLVVGLLILRSITAPLKGLSDVLQDIAQGEGDLTRRLPEDRSDELGKVAQWFNRFVTNIHGTISQLASTASNVSNSATALTLTADQMAAATSQAASQTTSVATASEEMSVTSQDISRNCILASEIAGRAAHNAQSGAIVVHDAMASMVTIAGKVRQSSETVMALGTRSEQIGAIVGTIEDIADQTNLLALNAAIEAARAGEMGRGFAVVADEVRALAERTTRSTHEISSMIRAIQQETSGAVAAMDEGVTEVEKGMESSTRSEQALKDILEEINNLAGQVHQIATAAEEQTATTSEISGNIHHINDVIQQTANGSQQTATAAVALSRLAEDVRHHLGRFKL